MARRLLVRSGVLTLVLLSLAAQSPKSSDLSEPVQDDPAPRYRGAAGTLAAGGMIFAGTLLAVGLQGTDTRFGSAHGYTQCDQWRIICSTKGTGTFNDVAIAFLATGAGLVVTGLVWLGVEWIVSKVTAKPERPVDAAAMALRF